MACLLAVLLVLGVLAVTALHTDDTVAWGVGVPNPGFSRLAQPVVHPGPSHRSFNVHPAGRDVRKTKLFEAPWDTQHDRGDADVEKLERLWAEAHLKASWEKEAAKGIPVPPIDEAVAGLSGGSDPAISFGDFISRSPDERLAEMVADFKACKSHADGAKIRGALEECIQAAEKELLQRGAVIGIPSSALSETDIQQLIAVTVRLRRFLGKSPAELIVDLRAGKLHDDHITQNCGSFHALIDLSHGGIRLATAIPKRALKALWHLVRAARGSQSLLAMLALDLLKACLSTDGNRTQTRDWLHTLVDSSRDAKRRVTTMPKRALKAFGGLIGAARGYRSKPRSSSGN